MNENAQDAQNDVNIKTYDKFMINDLSSIKKLSSDMSYPFEFNDSIRKSSLRKSVIDKSSVKKTVDRLSINTKSVVDKSSL